MQEFKDLQQENKMGALPIGKLLAKISLPIMISMLIQACYNIVDSIFVAKISENALTAVALAFPVQMLIISVAVGTGIGVNSLISRRLGEKRFEEANQAASHALVLMGASALLFMLMGLTLVNAFFRSFTDDAEIYSMGVSYLSIVMVFSFGIFMQIGCERIMQATGNTLYPMIMQIVGAVTNIILDPILIFGYFGIPAMGVAGAAIATVAGQILAMLLSFYLLFKKSAGIKVSFERFKLSLQTVKEIYAVGVPSIFMQSIGTVMTLGMNKILIFFTPTAVSVLGAYFKLNSFIFMPVFALNSGALSIIGYNYGARNPKRVMETLKRTILTALSIMLLGLLAFMLFPAQLLGLFEASPDMLAIGVPALRTIAISFPGAAIGISCSGLFQAIGKGSYSLIMSLLRQLVLILPVAYIFAQVYGLHMVWWSFPIAEVFSIAACLYMLQRVRTRLLAPLQLPREDEESIGVNLGRATR